MQTHIRVGDKRFRIEYPEITGNKYRQQEIKETLNGLRLLKWADAASKQELKAQVLILKVELRALKEKRRSWKEEGILSEPCNKEIKITYKVTSPMEEEEPSDYW